MENKLIAMIPARIGSKRIPKKNLRILDGKPLLQYAIEKCLNSECFDEVWVNSESETIGRLASTCGAKFYKRDKTLSSDNATNEDFIPDFLKSIPCDRIFMVNSTSPLLAVSTLQEFVRYSISSGKDTVFSIEECFAECVFEEDPINFTLKKKYNSQDIKPVGKLVWAVTSWRRETVLDVYDKGGCCIYSGSIGYFPIPKDQVCDLDTLEDWNIAEGHLAARRCDNKEQFWVG